jgi:hypothetical protein
MVKPSFLIFSKIEKGAIIMRGERLLQNLCHKSGVFIKRNSSTILTCVGAVGVVVTAVSAAKATPKALESVNVARETKGEELTKFEVVKAATPAYIPTFVIGVSTIACVFGANILNKQEQAALTSAYALLDGSYKEYKKKVEELYGKDGEFNVRKEIVKDHYVEEDMNIDLDDGIELFYDEFSERYFEAKPEDVVKAEYNINRKLSLFGGAFLNEFYEYLDMPRVDYGDYLGWSGAQIYDETWENWLDFYHEKVVMDDGLECTIISMSSEPMPDFEDY